MDDYLKCKESEIYEGKDTASMNSFHLIFLLDFKQTKDKEKKKQTQYINPYPSYSYIADQLLRQLGKQYQKFPMFKMLRGICKIFELTEMEIVHWGIINERSSYGSNYYQDLKQIKKQQWPFIVLRIFYNQLRLIMQHSINEYFSTQLQQHFILKSNQIQSIYQFLAFFTNYFRIEKSWFDQKINEFIKIEIFYKLHLTIKPVLDQISNQISIQMLNEQYQELRFPKHNIYQKNTGKVTDYNELVDAIIELAPPYQKDDDHENLASSKKVRRIKKLIKKKEYAQKDRSVRLEKKEEQLSAHDQFSQLSQIHQLSHFDDPNIVSNLFNMFSSNPFHRIGSKENFYGSAEQLNINSIGSKLGILADQLPKQFTTIETRKKSQNSIKE